MHYTFQTMLSSPGTLPKAFVYRRRTFSSFNEADSASSSQEIWADDYSTDYPSDHFKNQFEDIISTPAPAVITKSIQLTSDHDKDTNRHSQTHKRSLTTLLPFRISRMSSENSPNSPQQSPGKEKQDFVFMPSLTGDQDGHIRTAKNPTGISGWFNGTSEVVNIGVPVGEVAEKQPSKAPSAPLSRFAFFSKAPAPQQTQVAPELCDDLLTLNVRSALFPSGDQDPFSPSAFKNLLTNAEGLLTKMQTAYKLRTFSLHELQAEKEAQVDELEEAEIRATHLKLQLEDMAQRAMSHDQEMKKVLGELIKERQARAEEKEAREKSISLIKYHAMPALEESSVHSEDLEIDSFQRRSPWRRSDGTMHSDMSFESDDDSGAADSIFSRSMSPSVASVMEPGTLGVGQAVFTKVVNVNTTSPRRGATERPKSIQQRSTFQKILGGISPTAGDEEAQSKKGAEEEDISGLAVEGCRNCRSGHASVAWDTVDLLRTENKGLKGRIADLEHAVEGALDLVNGHNPRPLDF